MPTFVAGEPVKWKERIHVKTGIVIESDRYWTKVKRDDDDEDYDLIQTKKLRPLIPIDRT